MSHSSDSAVLAAGALCWRPAEAGGLEVLLVHSGRYDEWTWPKGKPEGDESLPLAAVREVAEESGVTIRLGRPLPMVEYDMPDGRHKRVRYWAAQPVGEGERTAADEEIDDAAWLAPEAARERLSRPGDGKPLDRLLELSAAGELDGSVLLALRHAKSRSRKGWKGSDADRPLNAQGRDQSDRLVPLIGCWQPQRLITSPWVRCRDTIAPYARATQIDLLDEDALTEDAVAHDLAATTTAVQTELAARDDVLICTHRPVLKAVVGALREAAGPQVRRRLPRSNPWLAKGELLVAYVSKNGGTPQLDAVERFRTP